MASPDVVTFPPINRGGPQFYVYGWVVHDESIGKLVGKNVGSMALPFLFRRRWDAHEGAGRFAQKHPEINPAT